MTPTIWREKGWRFFFFSREEPRAHVHVSCEDGEAKFWLDPDVELARNHGLSRVQLRDIEKIVEANHERFRNEWQKHLGS